MRSHYRLIDAARRAHQRVTDAYLYGLAAVTVFLVMSPVGAFAQTIGGFINNMTGDLSSAPTLLSDAAYLGGAGLGISGLHGINKHFQQPQQFPWHAAAAKIAIGASLVSFPTVLSAFSGTITGGSGGTLSPPRLPTF